MSFIMTDKISNGEEKEYNRFGINFRIQHIVLMLSTILLIVSGLPLKFYNTGWARVIMNLMGGPDVARKIHHLAAIFLIGVGIYHLGYIIIARTGRKDFKELIPKKKDLLDFKDQILFFFGKVKSKPKFGRFSFIEKFDYWAVYWGFVIMIGSGLIMWMFQGHLHPFGFNRIDLIFSSGLIDNYFHAISREAHSDEAFLATMAIILWHFYNVHFNPDKFPGSKVWLTGKMSRKEMEEEHPLELEEIEKNNHEVVFDDSIEKKPEDISTAETKTDEKSENEIQQQSFNNDQEDTAEDNSTIKKEET